jgi:predicted N-acetyltransferase YhbS
MFDIAGKGAAVAVATTARAASSVSGTPDTAFGIGAVRIVRESAADAGAREALLDRAFGPGRHLKTSARMRAGRFPAQGLSLLARDQDNGRLLGTVRLWTIVLGDGADGDGRSALLLGPLAVDTDAQSAGVGAKLMRHAIADAAFRGHAAIILVGDPEYYERFGFSADLTADLRLPGPVEQRRFLGLALRPGALAGATGLVRMMDTFAPVANDAPDLALAV